MSKTTITQLLDPSVFHPTRSPPSCAMGGQANRAGDPEGTGRDHVSLFGETLEDGRARLVRHAHLQEREVMTGIDPVPMNLLHMRDRGAGDDKITFTAPNAPKGVSAAKLVWPWPSN